MLVISDIIVTIGSTERKYYYSYPLLLSIITKLIGVIHGI